MEEPEIEIIEIVIIEDYIKADKPIPHGKIYRIKVDKTPYDFHHHETDGRAILAKAGKTPEDWKLYQVFHGRQPEPIGPDHKVDLKLHRIERFTTIPKDPGEGLVSEKLRREFSLPASDTEYLHSLGLDWETVKKETGMWVIIHGWRIPVGYNVATASLALLIPNDYPDTQIDMCFFSPSLSRTDGAGINNLTMQNVAGEQWQQWSRHRTGSHPWRPGVDDITTHLSLVDDWLRRELGRS